MATKTIKSKFLRLTQQKIMFIVESSCNCKFVMHFVTKQFQRAIFVGVWKKKKNFKQIDKSNNNYRLNASTYNWPN
ncbi:MAG: hypothetical protein COB38_07330 [Gammaproteobacteria bacterium]|nr:MAG: hypothetical protein COB38_07330 [Gammaproteobacteria bacterium]